MSGGPGRPLRVQLRIDDERRSAALGANCAGVASEAPTSVPARGRGRNDANLSYRGC